MTHTLHRMAQVCLVRVTHAHTCSVRISSTLSPPFPSTSSSLHSSSTFCTSSCTSSTTLRAVVTVNTIHLAPEIHEHIYVTKATEQCARLQAHPQQCGAQCEQLRERHNARQTSSPRSTEHTARRL